MKAWQGIGLGFAGVMCSLASMAQIHFSIATDKQDILIGEQVTARIDLCVGQNDRVEMPTWQDTLCKGVEVLSATSIDTVPDEKQSELLHYRQELTLTSFDSGYYAIKPVVAVVNGNPVPSNPFLISVMTVPIDTAQGMYDIRGIAEVPFDWSEWWSLYWKWIVGGVVLFAGLLWLMMWFARKESKPLPVVVKPLVPIDVRCLQRLDQLEAEKRWQAGDVKGYYIELSDIFRSYLEGRFVIPALEYTTEECVAALRRVPAVDAGQMEQCHRFLFLADLVKFAKERPAGSENEMFLAQIRAFIHATRAEANTVEQPDQTATQHG